MAVGSNGVWSVLVCLLVRSNTPLCFWTQVTLTFIPHSPTPSRCPRICLASNSRRLKQLGLLREVNCTQIMFDRERSEEETERDGRRDRCQREKIIAPGREATIRVALSPSVCWTAWPSHLDCCKQLGMWSRSGFKRVKPQRVSETWGTDNRDADWLEEWGVHYICYLTGYHLNLASMIHPVGVKGKSHVLHGCRSDYPWTYLRLNYVSVTVRMNVIQMDSPSFSLAELLGDPENWPTSQTIINVPDVTRSHSVSYSHSRMEPL